MLVKEVVQVPLDNVIIVLKIRMSNALKTLIQDY